MMIEGDDLSEKKLRGSGGHVFAKVTDEEQKKGNLGGPDLFLAGVGRLNEDRFSKYYCNKCEKEFQALVGMTAYDSEAMLVGRVLEIGLRKSPMGTMDISLKISKDENSYKNFETVATEEVLWKNISKIGDIVLLGERMRTSATNSPS